VTPSPDAEILRRLRPGASIPSSDLGEPTIIAGRIAVLRDAGYEIEHHPHLGYRLVSAPDRLIADDIVSRLAATRWLREVLVFEKTGSTNDLASGMGRGGAMPGVAILAEEQTAGRGRLGRRWQSDPRLGLWFSMLLRPALPVPQWTRLTLWAAWAVARGIEDAAGSMPIQLKWPNDLHLSGRKIAGILIETSLGENPFAVAGIGLNVNHPSFPPPLDGTATSLRIETGRKIDRNGLAAAILARIDASADMLRANFAEILEWARRVDCLRGRWVSAAAGVTIQEGTAEGLDDEGALLLRTAAGERIRLNSGEVSRFSAGRPGK
jgi:BirA family biotin operon repressor/biotin-[acetyl-CoA-carboxylase] ligase